jgi:hypothetical protein
MADPKNLRPGVPRLPVDPVTEARRPKPVDEPTIRKTPTKGGFSVETIAPVQPFRGETTVGGHEMIMAWYDDMSGHDYELYLPGIESIPTARDVGIHDAVIKVSQRPEVAKRVFEYAVRLAATTPDVVALYRAVEQFARDLPFELDDSAVDFVAPQESVVPERIQPKNPQEPTIVQLGSGSYRVEAPVQPYDEVAEVNGIQIEVGWYDDMSGRDYEIYFPGIDLSEARQRGIPDQVIKVSRRPEVAKRVFAYAKQMAALVDDVYTLYNRVKAFAEPLPFDLE